MELLQEALQAVALLIAVGVVVFLAPLVIMIVFALVSGFAGDQPTRTDDRDGE